ncbi:DUF6348 family protein [Comamonas guangdongensis]|uniref:DUF6348 family protein n=1 Tax=Comamonas guangdongensis TaxID=510515 RepID=A0ABV3ZSH3_9BURK
MPDQPESPPLSLQGLLTHTLSELGIKSRHEGERIALDDGLQLVPFELKTEARSNGSWSTSTVIEVHHPLIQDALFEYQHSAGSSLLESLRSGFRSWARMDLVTLQQAVQDELECPSLGMGYTDAQTGTEYRRQVVLGPMAHYRQYPPEPSATQADDEAGHDFCPCCLFTNSMDAFTDALQGREFVGVRLYAARDADGQVSADCRINGEDFPAALQHLEDYARSWPQAGLEFRKQYVVIRNQP